MESGNFSHKGFRGNYMYSDEDMCYIGKIKGIDSVVSYEGETISECNSAFIDAVEEHIEFCNNKGINTPKH